MSDNNDIAVTLEEIKEIIRELSIKIDSLDEVEMLLACSSGGVCQTACEKGCQACQPGNRFGPKGDLEEDDSTEE